MSKDSYKRVKVSQEKYELLIEQNKDQQATIDKLVGFAAFINPEWLSYTEERELKALINSVTEKSDGT